MCDNRIGTVQITAPHFCAGIVLNADKCINAAPIPKWRVGKSRSELRAYFATKGWSTKVIPSAQERGPASP